MPSKQFFTKRKETETSHKRAASQRRAKKTRLLEQSYGMETGEYTRRLRQQGYCCAICSTRHTVTKRLSIDHDHTTGHVRGLLCPVCNSGLGMFRDDEDLLVKALRYLMTTRSVMP